MSDIAMPASFPSDDFRAFGMAAIAFFPSLISDEALFDPQEKRRHFDWSWQAVRYRYRSCCEANDEFKALLNDESSKWWRAGGTDEEMVYKLERRIYAFFMSALSIFDSFAFCLYFFGHALESSRFPDVANPRAITRHSTTRAFNATFPQAAVTGLLAGLSQDTRFSNIDGVRNLVGHRISGRRSIRGSSIIERDGTHTLTHEESWHLPGSTASLTFDEELLQRHLDDVSALLSSLSLASRQFAEQEKQARGR